MAQTTYTPTRMPLVPRIFAGILNGLTRLTEANSRVQQAEYLNTLSDRELAARGLRREDIARYVFRDVMYM